jgi:hypothetical protein
MNTNDFIRSPKFKAILYLLAVLLGGILIFEGGVAVGYHRAAFSYQWNTNYFRDSRDPRSFFAVFSRDADDPNPHGAIGQVVSVNLPRFMVKGPNSPEQVVVIGPGTALRRFHGDGTTTDLKAGQQVIVIGSPDDQGEIRASFVRILPPLPTSSDTFQIPLAH